MADWTRNEMILALSLYFQLPFGRLNHTTPEVKELAALIGRTSNSVAIRLSNYASCDPYIINSGRTGLPGGRKKCQPYWDEYYNDRERLFYDAQIIKAEYLKQSIETSLQLTETDLKGTDHMAMVKQRVNQNVFRAMILNNYENRCAVTGIAIPELLVASHIIPWAENEEERLNPENGICLSALYDKAFDKGFISIDEHNRIILAEKLKRYEDRDFYAAHFASVEHQTIILPQEHLPNPLFLEWHRDCIFDKA